MLAAGVQFCPTPLHGALSDRTGRRPAAAGSYSPVALQIVVVGLISLVSVVLATETFRGEIAPAA